jgi:5-oxopent-3-ene-1,2,5-tricarboxylate decarboxylase/2-hydroxyhepta-2,4-diene-1,7-dioate isomerase
MKRARVAFDGAVHAVVAPVGAADDVLVLPDGRRATGDAVVWLPPVEPRTAFALAINYADHAKELAFRKPDAPLAFLKGRNTFIGHRARTRRTADATFMHYECELAVVIGTFARNVSAANAYDVIAGYTVANDYVIRDYLENYYRPNLRAKNRDGLTVLGPWLVDAADISDPMSLALTTRVNGTVTQRGNTRDMVFGIPALIEYLSSFMTLGPGDVILTGTPDGIVDVKPGDVVETEVERVGCLVSTIVGDAEYWCQAPLESGTNGTGALR